MENLLILLVILYVLYVVYKNIEFRIYRKRITDYLLKTFLAYPPLKIQSNVIGTAKIQDNAVTSKITAEKITDKHLERLGCTTLDASKITAELIS